MSKRTVRINPDVVMRLGVVHKAKLMRMSKDKNVSMTELIRKMIDEEFEK